MEGRAVTGRLGRRRGMARAAQHKWLLRTRLVRAGISFACCHSARELLNRVIGERQDREKIVFPTCGGRERNINDGKKGRFLAWTTGLYFSSGSLCYGRTERRDCRI